MDADGADADHQFGGDLAIGVPVRQQAHDFRFAPGKWHGKRTG